MDPAKVDAVTSWSTPRTVKDVQAFLGFANFYRRFIYKFSRIAAPLTNATRKDPATNKTAKLEWTPECDAAFTQLKAAFTTAPILAYFDPAKETMLETDASDHVVAGVLS